MHANSFFRENLDYITRHLEEHSSFPVNRSFFQICQNCIREKNSAKKLPPTGVEPLTLGLLLIFCLSCLATVLDPISCKTDTLMILI